MKRTLFVMLALVFALGVSAAAMDYMFNGGFDEDPPDAGWLLEGETAVYDPIAWSIGPSPNGGNCAGKVSSWGGSWDAPLGSFSQSVFLPGPGDYYLDFYLCLHAVAADPWRNVVLRAYVDGVQVFIKDVAATPTREWGDEWWEPVKVPVTINTLLPEIKFDYDIHFAEWSFVGVDGVSLSEVPEPSSMLVLGSSLIGLAGLAIRRRK